ncbi:2-dehydropantoate 2-reductase [Geodermatophilus bullaregiensis]|uniref:ketopantoate reductase family protein n=1 Tax=Geodermatophilus bullaregiensis TaxID=1564160 RepID=UPI00195E9F65|nr:2-dehydropantoate 2-reductase [Geodermatophilus bullaregiensis]MBM7805354.1 2-dehydropantoate 2-reductase [Geodermatophilus bullaregiensis]
MSGEPARDPSDALRVAVLGPGGVGGLLAALLTQAGASVTCLAGARTVEVLRTHGLRVESRLLGVVTTRVAAAEQLTAPVDVCLVCVKATHLDAALERVPADVLGNALVVPLLNGIEHVAELRRRRPRAAVVPAAIRVESTRIEPGVVRHDSPFVTVDLAATAGLRERVDRLTGVLERAGVTVRTSGDEAAVLWGKLAFLAPFALLTTSARAPVGQVRQERREDLLALVHEVASVARAEGVPIDAELVVAFLDSVPEGMRSSMQRDAAAGRPTELDAIGGAVVRAAGRHGIAVPVTARYVAELRAATD